MGVKWARAVLENSDAEGAARYVLLVLAIHARDQAKDEWEDGESWPSLRTLARETGLNRRTVTRNLARLEVLGEVERLRTIGRTTHYLMAIPPPFRRLRPPPGDQLPLAWGGGVVPLGEGSTTPSGRGLQPLGEGSRTPTNGRTREGQGEEQMEPLPEDVAANRAIAQDPKAHPAAVRAAEAYLCRHGLLAPVPAGPDLPAQEGQVQDDEGGQEGDPLVRVEVHDRDGQGRNDPPGEDEGKGYAEGDHPGSMGPGG